jgi:hypothetical protein
MVRPSPRIQMKLLKGICYMFGYYGFFLYYSGCHAFTHSDESLAMGPFGYFFAGLVCNVIGFGIGTLIGKLEQGPIDDNAAEILAKVRAGQDCRFFLYLRPFELTGRLPVKDPKYDNSPFPWTKYQAGHFFDLETSLRNAVAAAGSPLTTLGRPGEAVGAGRMLVSDEEWQKAFEELARSAQGIVVLPWHTSGVLWEMDWLRKNGLLHKTLFVQPAHGQVGNDWNNFRAAALEIGLLFPDFRKQGSIFKVDPDAHSTMFVYYPLEILNHTNAAANAIRSLLAAKIPAENAAAQGS